MGFSCIACGNTDGSISYFKIPFDATKKRIWLERCGVDPLCNVTDNTRICCLHFDDNSFTRSSNDVVSRRRLKSGAFPSICLDYRTDPSNKQKKKVYIRCLICGPVDTTERRSFHHFPKNSELRNEWIANLGIENPSNAPTHLSHIRLCNIHFNESDFSGNLKVAKHVHLRANAVPLKINKDADDRDLDIIHIEQSIIKQEPFVEEENRSYSDIEVLKSPPSEQSDVEMNTSKFSQPEPTDSQNIDSRINSSDLICEVLVNESLMFPNTRDVGCQVDDLEEPRTTCQCGNKSKASRKLNLKTPRYVGDINASFLATSNGAEMCISLAKKKIVDQQTTIKRLNQQLKHARKKVETLQEQLINLQETYLLS